ncbi:conserved protein of unknown function [Pseudomonas marincola]|uniref:Uncharacterized protein n=1 Tax=Pseudomonas marincola TaxID=437900 RepID=A0A653E078_9PSED|nr:conserved protein of unknown function [Pseudomonas marincola]
MASGGWLQSDPAGNVHNAIKRCTTAFGAAPRYLSSAVLMPQLATYALPQTKRTNA